MLYRPMKKLLQLLSDRELAVLCSHHGLPGRPFSRQEMVDALDGRMSDPDHMLSVLTSLRPPVLRFLRLMALTGLRKFADHDLTDLLGEPVAALRGEARAWGLVDSFDAVSLPAVRALGQLWATELAIPAVPVSDAGPFADIEADAGAPAPDAPPSTVPAALRNVVLLLSRGLRQELPLTREGEVYKKALSDLLAWSAPIQTVDEESVMAMMIDYAQQRGLLYEEEYPHAVARSGKGLAVSPLAAEWVKQDWAVLWADLADFLFNLFALVFGPVTLVLHTLLATPPGYWLPVDDWGASLDDAWQGLRVPWPPHSGALEHLLMQMTGLELLMAGQLTDGRLLVRPAPALVALLRGEAPALPTAEPLILHRDLTLDVPHTASAATLFRLEQLAPLRLLHQGNRFMLTPDGVRQALEQDEDAESLLAFFRAECRQPVPAEALETIQTWIAPTGRARFEQATLLRLTDAENAAQLQADARLRKWILGALTPTDLLVAPAGVEKLRAALRSLGVATVPGIGQAGAETGKTGKTGAETGEPAVTSGKPPAQTGRRAKQAGKAQAAESPGSLELPTPADMAEQWLGVPAQVAPGALLGQASAPVASAGDSARPTGHEARPANQAEAAAWLRAAAAKRQAVRIGYESEGEVKYLVVHPQRVLDDRLVGDCPELGGSRKFKLARIRSVTPLPHQSI